MAVVAVSVTDGATRPLDGIAAACNQSERYDVAEVDESPISQGRVMGAVNRGEPSSG